MCDQLKNPNGPFSKCLIKLGSSVEDYYRACIVDACTNKHLPKIQKTVVCQTYEAMATKCEGFGILAKWRSVMNCRELKYLLNFNNN